MKVIEARIPIDIQGTISHILEEDYVSKDSSEDFIQCLETCGFYPVNKCEVMTEMPLPKEELDKRPSKESQAKSQRYSGSYNWKKDEISPANDLIHFKESLVEVVGDE